MAERRTTLAGFDPAAMAELDAELTTRRLAGGEVLFEAGDPPDGLAVITRGQLTILDAEGNADGTFGRGDVVGEIGAVSGLPRTRTVVATRDTELRVMSQDRFEELFLQHPAVAREVSRLVATRLITEGSRPSPTRVPSTVALVRATEATDAADLLASLDRLVDPSTVVTRADLDTSDAGALAALDAIELGHDLVILDAGVLGADPAWEQRCVRQADTVVVSVDAASAARPDPALTVLAKELATLRSVTELVVVNPASAADPADATALHDLVAPDRLHHVRIGDAAPNDRAARLILGQGTALVLSGGGAKGMAHIGVWRALQELGIEIDAVAGVSFGALMAWGIALDYTPDELHAVTRQRLIDAKGVFDITLPLVAVLRGRGVADQLSDITGERTFDQLWRPLLVSSADLTSGTLVDHTRGSVWRGVRASMSIPGVFPPIRMGERLLVDGAVRDNLPIRSTRAHHPGPLRIIAVDVGDHTTLEAGAAPEDGAVSGWRQLRGKAPLPRRTARPGSGAPTIAQILMRVMDLSGAGSGGEAEAMIVPDLEGYGVADFEAIDELERLGYDAAIRVLA